MQCKLPDKVWKYCQSESDESSCSQSDDEYTFLPWLEKVGPNGDLFYIEEDISFNDEKRFFTIAPTSEKLPFETGTASLSATEKFKKWMKKRKHKVRKKFLHLKSNRYDTVDDEIFLNQLTFSARDIFVEVNVSRQTLGRRITLAEEVLGLEIGPLKEKDNPTDKIKIIGFVSGQKIPGIKIGDWLHSINDENVYLSNIDEILLKLDSPTKVSKVKLTLLSSRSESVDANKFLTKQSCIVGEYLGHLDIVKETKTLFHNLPYGVYFLKMLDNSEEESSLQEDVFFQYPNEETELFSLKGMFITLQDIVSEIASSPILSCSLKVKNETVHVGFFKEKHVLFVLAVPAICVTENECQYFVTNIVKLLKYLYSSLENIFSGESYKSTLENFFAMFFKYFLSEKLESEKSTNPHLYEIIRSSQWVPLPVDLKTEVDEILNELESSDFGSSSHGFYRNQRIYTILGSCLFYKGYLLCNHLNKDDFLDIYLFLHYHHILTLTKGEGVSELIIWKEVFPSRFNEKNYENSGLDEVCGRYLLLIVVMNNSILSILLEAGGCSIITEAKAHPPPEPFYVEEVQNTLIILHNYGITSVIEKSMRSCLPPLTTPDAYLIGDSTMHFPQFISVPAANSSVNPRSFQYSSSPSNVSCDKSPGDGESDIDSDYSNTSNENSPVLSRKSRNSSILSGSTSESQGSGEFFNHMYQRSADNRSNPEMNTSYIVINSYLRFSLGNSIFQYLHIDPVEGIFLAPTDEEYCFTNGITDNDILLNFHRCCMEIRSIFAKSLRNEEIMNSESHPKVRVNKFLCTVYEHGVLFCYTNKDKIKQKNSLNFWIVGRLFFTPHPREVYICYHDSIQQDIVEVAFKLGFGLSL